MMLRFRIFLVLAMLFSSFGLTASDWVSASKPGGDGDENPPPKSNRPVTESYGNSPVPAQESNDSNFVTDEGPWLDTYLYRSNVPNGRLSFTINIDRYYSHLINSTALQYRSLPEIINDLISKHLLPANSTLTLEVYDVDHDSPGCAEVDHIYINGKQVQDPKGGPAILTSGNATWSTWSISFPTSMLNLPVEKGLNGSRPTPAANVIEIDIDVNCSTSWAVEVDWGAISIPSPIRPLVFVHGWTADQNAFRDFYQWAQAEGIPSARPEDYERMIHPIANTAPWVAAEIAETAQEYGVDKVNLFAHSKGGLVSRSALRSDRVAQQVERLITFATPHHGTRWYEVARALPNIGGVIDPEWFIYMKCADNLDKIDPTQLQLCYESTQEFGIDRIRNEFNYQNCRWDWLAIPPGWKDCQQQYIRQPSVDYRSFATRFDEAVRPARSTTYPWMADSVPFPTDYRVDELYSIGVIGHSKLKEDRDVYECAISYIDPRIHGSFLNCAALTNLTLEQPDMAAENSQPDRLVTVFSVGRELAAGEQVSLMAYIDGTVHTIFQIYSTAPAAFTLTTPGGQLVNPALAESDPKITYRASEDEMMGWVYQYDVVDPQAGNWQHHIQAQEAAALMLWDQTESDLDLYSTTEQYTYRPGSLVLLEAALASSTSRVKASLVEGHIRKPDGSTSALVFYDNGSHEDRVAGDYIHTAAFPAGDIPGHAEISITAAQGSTVRKQTTSIAIAAQTAAFAGVIQERVVDSNSNGLFDWLEFDVSLEVLESGEYEVFAVLADANNIQITGSSYSTRLKGSGPLAVGNHTITLAFSGEEIYKHGVDGPYTLSSLSIVDTTNSALEVDSVSSAYTSAYYPVDSFERPLLSLASSNEEVADFDQNNRYDELSISVLLDVVYAGMYSWNGRLVDHRGAEIGWSTGSGYLDSSTPIVFTFDGRSIGENGEDGPYSLRDVSIFQTSGGIASVAWEEVHTTQPYSYLSFEGAIPKVRLTSAQYTIPEGGVTAVLSVTLNTVWDQPISVDFISQDGTAESGSDYEGISGTLTFEPGISVQQITVPVLDDTVDELDETLEVYLSNATNANPGIPITATLTIQDDDGPMVMFSQPDLIVAEHEEVLVASVKLSEASVQPVMVDYTVKGGTALVEQDFLAASGMLTFPAGTTEQEVSVTIVDDEQWEPDESFSIELNGTINAELVEPTLLICTIQNDDLAYTYIPFLNR